jgi:hypothetical protein
VIEPDHSSYYLDRKPQMLQHLQDSVKEWQPVLNLAFIKQFTEKVLPEVETCFEQLIPSIPYIGGEENHLTASLVGSAECLALYQAMQAHGKSAFETGKMLYDAIAQRFDEAIPEMPPSVRLSEDELMQRRRERAQRSQARKYPADFVYEFVEGDAECDYGYNFSECATQKFYQTLEAEEFLPFYCFLDFASSKRYGLGLLRSTTLAEGFPLCDFRFKRGRTGEPDWPPAFLSKH